MVHNEVLVGVVSWGKGCAMKHYPEFYTNVAYVRDWIKEVSGVLIFLNRINPIFKTKLVSFYKLSRFFIIQFSFHIYLTRPVSN